jgi:hypothetical protein
MVMSAIAASYLDPIHREMIVTYLRLYYDLLIVKASTVTWTVFEPAYGTSYGRNLAFHDLYDFKTVLLFKSIRCQVQDTAVP